MSSLYTPRSRGSGQHFRTVSTLDTPLTTLFNHPLALSTVGIRPRKKTLTHLDSNPRFVHTQNHSGTPTPPERDTYHLVKCLVRGDDAHDDAYRHLLRSLFGAPPLRSPMGTHSLIILVFCPSFSFFCFILFHFVFFVSCLYIFLWVPFHLISLLPCDPNMGC